jgi:hypothetical protein
LKGVVPLYVVGGGGAPLGRDTQVQDSSAAGDPPSKLPTDGYYDAWHLMTIDTSHASLLGQAPVDDQSFPVLESLAMHSYYGSDIPAGQTTDISAVARGLNGGFSDPDQSKAEYLRRGHDLSVCRYKAQGNGYCISGAATLPRFRFYSERPDIADFVKRSPTNDTAPVIDEGEVARDPGGAEGLLCTFKPGAVGIDAVAGLHRARIVLNVGPGAGQCTKLVYPPQPVRQHPVVKAVVKHQVVPDDQIFPRVRPHPEAIVVFPPPPAPAVAPAPPGAPGVGRKEEHEVEYETEKHEHNFTALATRRHRSTAEEAPWVLLGSLALLSFFGAVTAVGVRRRSYLPARSRAIR